MTTEQTPIEKIKDRIAKLLRMSKDSSSPEEAAIAAGRARSLMDKHQLDEFDVSDCVQDVFAQKRATALYKAIPKYMSILSVAVAKYNDCQAKYDDEYVGMELKRAIMFLGYKNDVDLVEMMFDRLLKIMHKLSKEHIQKTMPGVNMESPEAARVSALFKQGVVDELARRLQDMTVERDALTANKITGSSLVIIKSKAVDEKFGKAKYGTVRTRLLSENEENARTAGRIEGRKVTIVQAVR